MRNGRPPIKRPLNGVVVVRVYPILALALASCVGDPDPGSQESAEHNVAALVLELSIGETSTAVPEYQFSSIAEIIVVHDGTIWVADGGETATGFQTPQLRQYDSAGTFVRQVGREGSGPGEYRNPEGLALMRDGRVAMRDLGIPNRLTLFTTAGELDTIWSFGTALPWTSRARKALQVDTGGVVWLPFNTRPGPDRPRRVRTFVRMQGDGAIVDTVQLSAVPVVERDVVQIVRTLPNGGTSTRGFMLPFQPFGRWAWSPFGHFAVARTDVYRIELLPAPGVQPSPEGARAATASRSTIVEREIPPVPVPQAERRAARQRLTEEISAFDADARIRVPEVPTHKPPIKWIEFSEDGRLLVSVSMPSRRHDGEWTESNAYDVFDLDGGFQGRVVLPDSFWMFRMRGNHMWGLFRGPHGQESIRRYRVVWP